MKYRISALTLALMFISLCSFAQGAATIREKASRMPSTRIAFSETVFSASGLPLGGESGQLDIQYPCFYVLKGYLNIFGDGKSIWQFNTQSREVTVFDGDIDSLFGDAQVSSNAQGNEYTLNLPDGSKIKYHLISMEAMIERWTPDYFTFVPAAYGSDIIVTDLRASAKAAK